MPTKRNISQIITARESELTPGFSVFRALPRRDLRRVGGFVFLDHFDARDVRPDQFDVPPHPHIGLQTVTYLYDGEILHTDSLGFQHMIEPGAMNWMTSGRGITHSEQVAETQSRVRGLQLWVGLPHAFRKTEPAFNHFDADVFPTLAIDGAVVRVLAGKIGDDASPVPTFAPLTFYDVNVTRDTDAEITVDASHELAVYVTEGSVDIGGVTASKFDLASLSGGDTFAFRAAAGTRFAVIGGVPLAEPTVIYWNFIADTLGEAKQALIDWEEGKFPTVDKYRKFDV